MKALWQGNLYNDDRLFVLDLRVAQKTAATVWAVVTRRNVESYPPFRVDDFPTKDAAVAFIERIEPTTPRVSLGGNSPSRPLSYPDYIAALRAEGIPGAKQMHDLNKHGRRELEILELSEADLGST